MSRKIQRRSVWRDGQRRRSPRISALDTAWQLGDQPTTATTTTPDPFSSHNNCMHQDSDQGDDRQGPTSRTRAKIKRKLQQLGRESPNHEDRSTNSGQPSSVIAPIPFMLEKRILELVLDILQRRDTYEIFAEPVDPKEVEDYYEIIEEPMDFGTMRAKLHEGMYKNLEQFERDAFLIPRNAMHFNSTATIYFRQARTIYELAKNVFHVLKTDPGNFELEFSRTRRRSGRRPQLGEGKRFNFNTCPRLATNVRSSRMTTDVSSKGTPPPRSLSGPSNLRGNSGFYCTPTCVDTRDYDFSPAGARDVRRSNYVEADRRSTYRPWMSFHNENDSLVSTIYSDAKPMARVNDQWDTSYRESLMLFAKDLGPTAQMIANRKLQRWWKDEDAAPPPPLNFETPPGSNYWGQQAAACQVAAALAFASSQKDIRNNDTSKKSVAAATVDSGKMDNNNNKVQQSILILASEHSPHSNEFEFQFRDNSNSSTPSSWPRHTTTTTTAGGGLSSLGRTDGSMHGTGAYEPPTGTAAEGPKGGMSSSNSDQEVGTVESNGAVIRSLVPLPRPFAFDLPFLKSRLNQMNDQVVDGCFLQPSRRRRRFQQEVSVVDQAGQIIMSKKKRTTFECSTTTRSTDQPYYCPQLAIHDNQKECSVILDTPDTNLALQL